MKIKNKTYLNIMNELKKAEKERVSQKEEIAYLNKKITRDSGLFNSILDESIIRNKALQLLFPLVPQEELLKLLAELSDFRYDKKQKV